MTANQRTLVYLVSPAGAPNYGDELIAQTWLRHLALVAPDADVVVDCLDAAKAAPHLAGLHPRVSFTDTLWQLCRRHWTLGAQGAAVAAERLVRSPGDAGDLAAGIERLLRADVLHLLGGGYVNAIWSPCVGLLSGIATAADLSGAVAAMTGQGLWPAPVNTGGLLSDLIARFDVVDVRDQPSAELTGRPEVRPTCDDALLGLVPHNAAGAEPAAVPGGPEVMVSVQSHLVEVEPAELVAFIGSVLEEWGVDGIGLLECSPKEDRSILALAERKLPVLRRYSVAEVLADALPAAPGQCWISTRFHPHLVAAAAGASGIALSTRADYYGTKHRSLVESGSGWSLVEKLEIPPRPAAGGYPAERLEQLRGEKLRVARLLYPAGRLSALR